MTKIKLGIIGCGIAAKELHLPALLKLKDKFEITALCNHTEQKAKEMSEMLGGVPYYLDYREMLKNADVDSVDVVLPIQYNYEVTKAALEAGKHVIVEKPIAVNIEEAGKMLSFPAKYKHVMMVAENFRYRNVFVKVKELLTGGVIGAAYAAVWDLYNYVAVNSKYAQTEWRRHNQYPGGFITDAGVHNIAALRMLFGEITSVNAFSKSINPAIGTLDTMSMQFKTNNDVNGLFNIFFSTKGYYENRLLIFGNESTIEVKENIIAVKKNGEPDHVIDASDDSGYKAEFEDFYNAIINGKEVISTFEEAYKDFNVILAALKSAEEGKHILL